MVREGGREGGDGREGRRDRGREAKEGGREGREGREGGREGGKERDLVLITVFLIRFILGLFVSTCIIMSSCIIHE